MTKAKKDELGAFEPVLDVTDSEVKAVARAVKVAAAKLVGYRIDAQAGTVTAVFCDGPETGRKTAPFKAAAEK